MRAFTLLQRRFGPLAALSGRELRLTRREALRAALAAGAGLVSAGCSLRARPRGDAPRVVVAGAGLAGLACAHELAAAGCDVRVLEARARVGGRVRTLRDLVPGRPVEGGAELIGSNHPTWIAYAARFGLEFRDVSEEEELRAPLLLGGVLLDDAQGERVWEALAPGLATIDAAARAVDADEPWRSPDAAALDAESVERAWLARLDADPLARAAIGAQLAGDNGVANERASWLGLLAVVKGGGLERYWTDSEVFRCAQGNEALAAALAAALGERLATGCPVQAIDATRAPVRVACADGRALECDDVVLAVPPSLWPRLAIEPALPAALGWQMGVSTKLVTRVARRFWRDAGRSQYALSDGLVSWTWESTDGEPIGSGPAGLTAFAGGPAAERGRALPAAERERALRDELETLQPGFSASVEAMRWMDWPSEPWTRAGYSFPAPGEVVRAGPILRRGLGPVHFCGEHASHAFVGYMEGALASGAALARRLAARAGLVRAG